ncbi:MAG: tetratricopeptide repeat protein [Cyclobacteriaceae bacterium]|nr:tetratricopeptide repeat protein [Cyclobacteriaceae bacterium]UYN88406.1 MAG: tetratricopeptide repeat protein [Cyclobacteriaceae bacterium]
MNLTRIEQLLKYVEEDPNDSFSLYALALEYKKNNPIEALKLFRQLLINHPDYLPTYYQAGLMMEESGNINEALNLYGQGIGLARKQNDMGTLKELQAAYNLLADDP